MSRSKILSVELLSLLTAHLSVVWKMWMCFLRVRWMCPFPRQVGRVYTVSGVSRLLNETQTKH